MWEFNLIIYLVVVVLIELRREGFVFKPIKDLQQVFTLGLQKWRCSKQSRGRRRWGHPWRTGQSVSSGGLLAWTRCVYVFMYICCIYTCICMCVNLHAYVCLPVRVPFPFQSLIFASPFPPPPRFFSSNVLQFASYFHSL